MHTYMHTYMHACMHTYIHKYIYIYHIERERERVKQQYVGLSIDIWGSNRQHMGIYLSHKTRGIQEQ